jgi:tetratricopeptide (TPR) repeat protein
MNRLLTSFAIVSATIAFGQTAEDHLQSGIAKHNKRDYKGAIADYSRAIKADNRMKEAYFNRATCELALQDLEAAMKDFTSTLELDPGFAKAYYSRATVYVTQNKYAEALPDLDKAIGLDSTLPNALTLRGQLRAQTGNNNGACEDFHMAKKNGDPQADRYINQFCGNQQQAGESLQLRWPESENWKVGAEQENDQQHVIDFIHTDETIEAWTELGNMSAIKGVKGVPVEEAMNLMFDQAKQNAPKATLTFIEKDETTEYPWIIFTIEAPYFKNDKTPESQLWYIVQGKQALYTNFIAVKQATIPENLKEKWTAFFKTGQVVTR